MKKEIADKWVAALRSGEYKQGRFVLNNRTNNSFCCLGVLCELAIADNVDVTVGAVDRQVEGFGYASVKTYYDSEGVLPSIVVQYGGLNSDCGELYDDPDDLHKTSLTEMNDGEGCRPHNFNEIADYIEENWEKL